MVGFPAGEVEREMSPLSQSVLYGHSGRERKWLDSMPTQLQLDLVGRGGPTATVSAVGRGRGQGWQSTTGQASPERRE